MKRSEYNQVKQILQKETSEKRHKADLILSRVAEFMQEMQELLFENGQFVKPKTIQILRWWRIGQKTINFISDLIKLIL